MTAKWHKAPDHGYGPDAYRVEPQARQEVATPSPEAWTRYAAQRGMAAVGVGLGLALALLSAYAVLTLGPSPVRLCVLFFGGGLTSQCVALLVAGR